MRSTFFTSTSSAYEVKQCNYVLLHIKCTFLVHDIFKSQASFMYFQIQQKKKQPAEVIKHKVQWLSETSSTAWAQGNGKDKRITSSFI